MRVLILVAALAIGVAVAASAEEGLIAHWDFDEGAGAVLHDRTDNGNDGAIHGATWVKSGPGFALRFSGADDVVDFGAAPKLNLTGNVSLEAWVFAEAVPGGGEAGIVGKDFGSYLLTYYTDGQCWWYISGGGNNCKAPLQVGQWHHVVGAFDGATLKLYVDGALAFTTKSAAPAIGAGKPFLMGTSQGDEQYTRGAHFKGMLDEVRLYDRALSAEEVTAHYRTTHLTNQIALSPSVFRFSGTVQVEMDLRGLGELPAGAAGRLEFWKPGALEPIQIINTPLPQWGTTAATFKLGDPPAGEYEIRALVVMPDGKQVGAPTTCPLTWPARPLWKTAPKARVLNNFVTELLNEKSLPRKKPGAFEFTNPRDGWVFFSCGAYADAINPVEIALDGKPLLTLQNVETGEAMRLLPKGTHRVTATPQGDCAFDRLVVRAIPELLYSKFGADPHVSEYGPYDWEFLSKDVLPNINVMIGNGDPKQKQFIEMWKTQGKQWIVECSVPGLANTTITAKEAYKYWSEHPGMTDPLLDGVIADEFGGDDADRYAAWTRAVRELAANDKLKGRAFYPYCGAMYGSRSPRDFTQAVMDAGWAFSFERYLPEQRSPEAARGYLDSTLRRPIAAWEAAQPGAVAHMIVNIGYMSQPPESLNVNPSMNYKVWLDMQLNLLANDPACFGLRGVMTYLSSYSDEETVRWAGKLFRHYCIEGQSGPLTHDPLMLSHIENPDFEDGLTGWSASPAEGESIAAKTLDGFSWLQGRYPPTSEGKTGVWMKRSAQHPNVISQTVKNLRPGRLYSLKMFSGDFQDLSVKQKLAITIKLTDADVLPKQSFQDVFPNCYAHHFGPFDDKHQAWMNYHWIVFRAKGKEAKLEISDWASDTEPGGPAGQELFMNFVEVQPYEG